MADITIRNVPSFLLKYYGWLESFSRAGAVKPGRTYEALLEPGEWETFLHYLLDNWYDDTVSADPSLERESVFNAKMRMIAIMKEAHYPRGDNDQA